MRYIVIAIAAVVLFLPVFWLFSTVAGDNWGAEIAAVAMYLAFPVLLIEVWPAPTKRKSDTMSEALASGVLSSAAYEVGDVVEAEDPRSGLTPLRSGKATPAFSRYSQRNIA